MKNSRYNNMVPFHNINNVIGQKKSFSPCENPRYTDIIRKQIYLHFSEDSI